MKTLPKTSMHLNVCGSNFFKLRKLLHDFRDPKKSFKKSLSKNCLLYTSPSPRDNR